MIVSAADIKTHYPVSLTFGKLEPSIRAVEREKLIALVGKPVYDYLTSTDPAPNSDVLYEAKELVVCFSIAHALPSLRVQVQDGGLVVTDGEDKKAASVWQTDDLIEDLERRAYSAADRLIVLLDGLSPALEAWTNSAERKAEFRYTVRNAVEFSRHYAIRPDRATYLSLRRFVERAEEDDLRPILGDTLFTSFRSALESTSALSEELETLRVRSARTVVLSAASYALNELPFEFTAEGLIVRHRARNEAKERRSPAQESIRAAREDVIRRRAGAKEELIKWLNANASTYSEFSASSSYIAPPETFKPNSDSYNTKPDSRIHVVN